MSASSECKYLRTLPSAAARKPWSGERSGCHDPEGGTETEFPGEKVAGKDHCQTLRSGRQLGEGWLWLPTPAACSGVRIWGTSTPPRAEEGRDKEEPFTPPKAALRGDGNQPSANLGPVSPSAANVAQGRGCTVNEHTASSRNPCDLASGSGGLRSEPGGR